MLPRISRKIDNMDWISFKKKKKKKRGIKPNEKNLDTLGVNFWAKFFTDSMLNRSPKNLYL